MPAPRSLTFFLIALLLAVGLDVALSYWLRAYYRKRGLNFPSADQTVYVQGYYSPVLTWLRWHISPLFSRRALAEWGNRLRRLLGRAWQTSFTQQQPEDRPNQQPAGGIRARKICGRITTWGKVAELILITLVVFSFCRRFINISGEFDLPGMETEIFRALDWVLFHSLKDYGKLPLWNPYLHTGLPFIGDPMAHVFNPLVSLPVLVFGVRKGFQFGLFLSVLFAAFGMWWLGKKLGMGPLSRVWLALMYAFAGQPIGRFLHGQYLFILGFAWIPWSVYGLFQAAQTRRRRDIALAAVPLALLFFSGNAYYILYMLFTIGLFALVILFNIQRKKPFLSFNFNCSLILPVIGTMALGMVALQLLPTMEFWPRISKGIDLAGSQTIPQILQDFISKQDYRPDAYPGMPANEEYYAYIGWMPLLALAFLPLAIWKRERRPIIFLLLLLSFVVVWINVERLPWYEAFLQTRLLIQFRHLLRILVYGIFSILLLAGFGLDTLLKILGSTIAPRTSSGWGRLRSFLAVLGIAITGLWMLAGISDIYRTNQRITQPQQINQTTKEIMRWLRDYDLTTFYVRFNPNNAGHEAVISSDLYFMDAWYHFTDIRQFDGMVNQRPVQARPNYVVQTTAEPLPETPAVPVHQIQEFIIYYLPESLPYAFSVNREILRKETGTSELKRVDVIPLTPYIDSPNRVKIIASGQAEDYLALMITHYPGWRVEIDGKSAALKNLGGYLAVSMKPGVHQYTFSFTPRSFYAGLVISLLFAGLAGYLVFSDLHIRWRIIIQGWRNALSQPNLKIPALTSRLRSWFEALSKVSKLEVILFLLALLVYLLTRLWALDRFPVYFFADEAVQTLYGEKLIAQHFRDTQGALFPIYVEAAGFRWTPLLPMYLHALTLTLFGKSIAVTRATSAVVSILGVLAAGLALKLVFKSRYPWSVILLLTITPAWFLHSRTAFETVMTTSFYACFLLFYLLYRCKSPGYFYPAVVFGAATFYTYSNAQLIMAAIAILLFISDLPYHLRQWKTILIGMILLGVLAWPLINFRLHQPKAIGDHLRAIDSYWFHAIPLKDKIATFLQKYTYGLSPAYWFFPHEQDLPRHRWAGLGHMHYISLPLLLVGLVVCLRRVRSAEYRTVILAGLAVPVGASLAGIGITRILAFVIPANLLAAMGLEWLLDRLKNRIPHAAVALVVFLTIAGVSFGMLHAALVKSPLWFHDYGLYGMQYGAKQLFIEAIPEYLKRDSKAHIYVTSTWANGADEFLKFFFTPQEQQRVSMGSVDTYLFRRQPLDENMVFVMTASEYDKAVSSLKFQSVNMDQLIPYPDGSPGFYIARLAYADNADGIFTAEQEARRQLEVKQMRLWGQPVELHYSKIDMGSPENMFDGDHFTLMRGLEANPFILEFDLSEPRTVTGLEADLGLVDIQITVKLYVDSSSEPAVYTLKRPNQGDPMVYMTFTNPPKNVSKVHIEFYNYVVGEIANIHIIELKLLP